MYDFIPFYAVYLTYFFDIHLKFVHCLTFVHINHVFSKTHVFEVAGIFDVNGVLCVKIFQCMQLFRLFIVYIDEASKGPFLMYLSEIRKEW